jgi:hypothetical protein
MNPDDPEVERAIRATSARVQELFDELHAAHPPLRGSLAIPGTFVGHGLGAFVASGMSNDQIIASVLSIVAQVRQVQSTESAVLS